MKADDLQVRTAMSDGLVIPACPLALNSGRRLDERRQRTLLRYYSTAGVGGIAVGVHTTQFQIRDEKIGLIRPVLELASDEMQRLDEKRARPMVRIGGICGFTKQAESEARMLVDLKYHAGLLSLAAMKDADDAALIAHTKRISDIIPIVGFYLQPAVGGRRLSYDFWRRFCEIENVVAIKIAPFNRYQTLDVMRAVAESGREDVALYTGNDDNIVADLLTGFQFKVNGKRVERRIVGGLLGHWAVWTRAAVQLLEKCKIAVRTNQNYAELLRVGVEVTDANAAFFDAANGFAGCIAGLHEVLRRQGLFEGVWCLDPSEGLRAGQSAEIDRVCAAYPHLADDDFVAAGLYDWLK